MDETNRSDQRRSDLEERIENLEQTVAKMLPDRRAVVKGAGAVGLLGLGAGRATAEETASDDTVDLGSPENRVDVFAERIDAETISANRTNNVYVASNSDELQAVIDEAAESIDDDRVNGRIERPAVYLVPNKTYEVDETIVLREFVCLIPNNATLVPRSDVDVLFLDTGTRIAGPLNITTTEFDGFSSNALVADTERSSRNWYRTLSNHHFRIDGPINLQGTRGEGTGFYLHSVDDGFISHCSATIDLRGFDIGIHADTTDGGFINNIHIDYEANQVNTGILTEGANYESGGKLIVHGHLQLGRMNYGIRNVGSKYSIIFLGHLEDPQRVSEAAISGEMIKVIDPYIRLGSLSEYEFDVGTTINGYGEYNPSRDYEVSTNRFNYDGEPNRRHYSNGDIVRLTDKDNPDNDGLYMLLVENEWVQITSL